MFDSKMTRRNFAATLATGAATLGLVGTSATTAKAYQGNMERGLSSLHQALESIKEATPNKGGHRERAINLISQAISETEAGITFANQHGGGGG